MTISQYPGSQAFNQSLQAQEYVNKNTGSLVVQIPLAQLRGKTEAIGVGLNAFYSAGSKGQLGLPSGWGFNLPFVANDETFTFQGKIYIIDPNWTDSSGYQSGLRYLNDHGRKFQKFVVDQPLPSAPGSYRYLFTYDNGSKSYFDATGKLLLQADLFGNSITYNYTDSFGDVFGNKLASITDSFGQVIQLQYAPGEVVVLLPDGSTQIIEFSNEGIYRITNQIGARTELTYTSQSDVTVVQQIAYATGLISTYQYTAIEYLNEEGQVQSFPAVELHRHSNLNDVFLGETRYSYGTQSQGNTFTGYTQGYQLSTSGDTLMNSQDTEYLYDVLVQRFDETGTRLSASSIFYNYLHSPMQEYAYLLDENHNGVNALRTLFSYEQITDLHDRSVNIGKPSTVVRSIYDPAEDKWIDQSKVENKYNDFGNLTQNKTYDLTNEEALLVSQLDHSFAQTSWGGQMPLETNQQDLLGDHQIKLSFILTQDQKNIATVTTSEMKSGQPEFLPIKTKSYFYDEHGQQTRWELAWADGYTGERGDLSSVSNTILSQYNAETQELSVSLTNAIGETSQFFYDLRLPMGPCVRQISPSGDTYQLRYDALGHLTSTTDPLGREKTFSYTLAQGEPESDSAGENMVLIHNANGYELRTTYDALGRAILLVDNGNPTQTTPVLDRQLRTITYNALGLKASETTITGATAQYTYDALGQLIQQTDPLGNILEVHRDNVNRKAESILNGSLRTQSRYDGLNQVVEVRNYQFTEEGTPENYNGTLLTYNGFGLVTHQNTFNVSDAEKTDISTVTYEYNADTMQTRKTVSGMSQEAGLQAQATTETAYNLLQKPRQTHQTVTYNGVPQATVSGDILSYDGLGNLISATNALGQSEEFTYAPGGLLESYRRYDGTTTTYSYNAVGELISAQTGEETYTYSYLLNDLVSEVSNGSESSSYEYSLDGTALAIHYPDGKSIKFTKDAYSRVTHCQLPDETQLTYTYNHLNQISQQTAGNLTMNNGWGTANGMQGVLISQQFSGPLSQQISYEYGGYGEVEHVETTDENGQIIYRAQMPRNPQGQLSSLSSSYPLLSGELVEINKSMVYDGIGQLVSSTLRTANETKTNTFSYDGAGNILRHSSNGQTTNYQYNEINQLISQGATYDANGNMIQDVDGATYTFSTTNQLLAAQPPGEQSVQNTYGLDGLLDQVKTGSNASKFYNIAGCVASVATGTDENAPKYHSLFWANSQLVGQVNPESTTLFSSAAGSVRLHTTSNAKTDIQISDYGTIKSSTALTPPNSLNWNAQYTNPESSLTYLRTRWYSPKSMRFLSLDPVYSINRYAYADGNPIMKSDPSGLLSDEAWLGLLAGIGVAILIVVGGEFVLAGTLAAEAVEASYWARASIAAASSVGGDVTNSLIIGEDITAKQIIVDILAGFAGFAAAEKVANASTTSALRSALETNSTAISVQKQARVTSGVLGGLADAITAGAVSSIGNNQPFFSSQNLISIVVGGTSGGYFAGRKVNLKDSEVVPVPINDNEISLISGDKFSELDTISFETKDSASKIINSFLPNVDELSSGRARSRAPVSSNQLTLKFRVIDGVIHVRSNIVGPEKVLRPVTNRVFANAVKREIDTTNKEIIFLTKGTFNDAQSIAEMLQATVKGNLSYS
ncbi:putative deoxyribonuclease RhsA [Pseudovibrio sp. W64]|uniref:RHS repeat domain-containing protein n=1 Tax=Pseudovibrio sp. W64 TaxID=1735583 RepID=UPI0007AE9C7F|nr:RHS repeat-associated core domain-containing protein [Pseudovibrio sp. W64]KZK89818.1 putative deoxyribonuclease RhsA [Pseudovibrio sp. W64]